MGVSKRSHKQRGRFLSAALYQAPAMEGRSALHVHSRVNGIDEFGVFLPFNKKGQLDLSRSISGATFFTDTVYAFRSGLSSSNESKTAHIIAEATQMAAGSMALLQAVELNATGTTS